MFQESNNYFSQAIADNATKLRPLTIRYSIDGGTTFRTITLMDLAGNRLLVETGSAIVFNRESAVHMRQLKIRYSSNKGEYYADFGTFDRGNASVTVKDGIRTVDASGNHGGLWGLSGVFDGYVLIGIDGVQYKIAIQRP